MTFTVATPRDAREIVALHEAVAEHLGRAIPGARPWRVPREPQIAALMKTTDVVLARDGEALVASFRLDPARGFCGVAPFTKVESFVYLFEMAVHPSQHRRGVGRHCLEEAERWSRARGAKAIRVDTNDDGVRAGDFYRVCGYREVARIGQTLYLERIL